MAEGSRCEDAVCTGSLWVARRVRLRKRAHLLRCEAHRQELLRLGGLAALFLGREPGLLAGLGLRVHVVLVVVVEEDVFQVALLLQHGLELPQVHCRHCLL